MVEVGVDSPVDDGSGVVQPPPLVVVGACVPPLLLLCITMGNVEINDDEGGTTAVGFTMPPLVDVAGGGAIAVKPMTAAASLKNEARDTTTTNHNI